jgi:hypothetical protein
MRQAGLQQANPSDPRLQALLDSGVTPEELADVAREAVAKGKGWPWVLATAGGRRRDAAGLAKAIPSATPAGPRPESDAERYEREERERLARTPEQVAANVAAKERAIAIARQHLSIAPRARPAAKGPEA